MDEHKAVQMCGTQEAVFAECDNEKPKFVHLKQFPLR